MSAEKILQVKEDIIRKSNDDASMAEIVSQIRWKVYEEWYYSCSNIHDANLRSQQTALPNLQYVILDSLTILDDLNKLTGAENPHIAN